MLGGMAWFFYLYSSAEARMRQSQQDVYRMIDSNFNLELSDTTKDKLAMSFLLRASADNIKDMLYPFLLVINGCLFLLIHERKKAEHVRPDRPLTAP